MSEYERFKVAGVRWQYASSEDGAEGIPTQIRTGVESAEVTCRECGTSWTARREGENRFGSTAGAIELTCPVCKVTESIPTEALEGSED